GALEQELDLLALALAQGFENIRSANSVWEVFDNFTRLIDEEAQRQAQQTSASAPSAPAAAGSSAMSGAQATSDAPASSEATGDAPATSGAPEAGGAPATSGAPTVSEAPATSDTPAITVTDARAAQGGSVSTEDRAAGMGRLVDLMAGR